MVPRWISSRPNLSARAKKMQRAYAGRRIGSRTDSYREGCKKSASQAAEDEASAPGAPRPLSFCGLRSKSLLWLAAVTLAGAVLLVLYSNLRSSAEVDPRALGADSGFAMTRGSFEVAAVATSGLIQPFEVADVGCAGFGAALNPARPIFVT